MTQVIRRGWRIWRRGLVSALLFSAGEEINRQVSGEQADALSLGVHYHRWEVRPGDGSSQNVANPLRRTGHHSYRFVIRQVYRQAAAAGALNCHPFGQQ